MKKGTLNNPFNKERAVTMSLIKNNIDDIVAHAQASIADDFQCVLGKSVLSFTKVKHFANKDGWLSLASDGYEFSQHEGYTKYALRVHAGAAGRMFYVIYYGAIVVTVTDAQFSSQQMFVKQIKEEGLVVPVVEPAKVEPEEPPVFWFGSGRPMEPKKLERQSLWGGWPMAANYRSVACGRW